MSGKEPAYEGWGDKRPYMAELLKKFHYFDSYLKNGTDLKADRLSKLWSCPTNCAWSRTGWVLANVIEETLKDNITVTLAKDPHACSVLATGPDGKFILNKEKDYLECDRDGQNYLFQRFRPLPLRGRGCRDGRAALCEKSCLTQGNGKQHAAQVSARKHPGT